VRVLSVDGNRVGRVLIGPPLPPPPDEDDDDEH
jgi:hypothetical protein